MPSTKEVGGVWCHQRYLEFDGGGGPQGGSRNHGGIISGPSTTISPFSSGSGWYRVRDGSGYGLLLSRHNIRSISAMAASISSGLREPASGRWGTVVSGSEKFREGSRLRDGQALFAPSQVVASGRPRDVGTWSTPVLGLCSTKRPQKAPQEIPQQIDSSIFLLGSIISQSSLLSPCPQCPRVPKRSKKQQKIQTYQWVERFFKFLVETDAPRPRPCPRFEAHVSVVSIFLIFGILLFNFI
jgi:hypothetical protein